MAQNHADSGTVPERRGLSVSVSMGVAMAIFVLTVASTFLLLQSQLFSNSGFSAQEAGAAHYAFTVFEDETGWTVERVPVIVHSDQQLTDEPLVINTPFPKDAVPSSIAFTRHGTEHVSQHNVTSNRSVIVANISSGTNLAAYVYTKQASLPDRTYSTALTQGGNATWNQYLNVSFDRDGFDSITYDGFDVLASPADLGASSNPQFATDVLETVATYDEADRKEVSVYDQASQLRVNETFTGEETWLLNLSSRFETMYSDETGSTVDLENTGTLYSGSTDFVDFYNSSSKGFGIIGDDVYVTVTRDTLTSPVDVKINFTDDGGRKRLRLYTHDGDYTNALPHRNAFYNPYNVSVGAPVQRSGVSRDRATRLESQSYETVRDRLGLTGSQYNITVTDVFAKGIPVTTSTSVHVFSFPVPVMDRFANVTAKQLQMRVWTG